MGTEDKLIVHWYQWAYGILTFPFNLLINAIFSKTIPAYSSDGKRTGELGMPREDWNKMSKQEKYITRINEDLRTEHGRWFWRESRRHHRKAREYYGHDDSDLDVYEETDKQLRVQNREMYLLFKKMYGIEDAQ